MRLMVDGLHLAGEKTIYILPPACNGVLTGTSRTC